MLDFTPNSMSFAAAPFADSEAPRARVSQAVVALREQRCISVLDLALRAGMLPDHLRAIESGLEPTVTELQALALALDVEVSELGAPTLR